MSSASGAFTAGETVTGSLSGATGTVAATTTFAVRTYSFSYSNITNLYRGNQIDVAGEPSYTSSISNDVAL